MLQYKIFFLLFFSLKKAQSIIIAMANRIKTYLFFLVIKETNNFPKYTHTFFYLIFYYILEYKTILNDIYIYIKIVIHSKTQ